MDKRSFKYRMRALLLLSKANDQKMKKNYSEAEKLERDANEYLKLSKNRNK